MCMHNQDFSKDRVPVDDDNLKISDRVKAEDLPIVDGLADAARNALLSRRERIRMSLEAAGG